MLIAALAALIVLAAGAAGAQPNPLKKEQLYGSWTLVSLDLTVEGKKSHPFGSPPKGTMHLDRNGSYSILLFRPGTPGFAAKNRLKGTDAEYKAAGQNSQAYYGTYRVNVAKLLNAIFPGMALGAGFRCACRANARSMRLSGRFLKAV